MSAKVPFSLAVDIRSIKLELHRGAIYAQASNMLLRSAGDFQRELGSALVEALGWHLDDVFLNGDGAGKPLGILNSASMLTVSKESGQAADTVVPENIVKMWARLHPRSHRRAIWIANPTTIPQMLLLEKVVRNDAGTDAVGGYSWFIQGSNSGDAPTTLLGRPIYYTEKLPVLGDGADIVLCDPSQYALAFNAELGLSTVATSDHVKFMEDQTMFRLQVYVDAQPTWASPFTPKNGDSLSWAVALGPRA